MKKSLVIIAMLIALLTSTGILAYGVQTQITVYEKNSDGSSVTLKNYDVKAAGSVEVPKTYDGVPVTAIAENAFLNCTDVTSVIVHQTVTEIGDFALGYIQNENGEKIKKEDFVILGRMGSAAQEYAAENGFDFRVYLTVPKLVSAKSEVGGIAVKWQYTENAKGYNVYRKTQKSKWKLIKYVEGETKGSYFDSTLKSGANYTYTVRAVYDDLKSSYDKHGVSAFYVSAPIVTLSNTKQGIKINWTKTQGATSYRVYRKLPAENKWTKLKTVKNNVFTYNYNTQKSGQRAYFCVVAVQNEYKSNYEKTKDIVYLSEPSVTSVKNSTLGIKIKWSQVPGAESYRLYRKVNGGKWKSIKNFSNLTFSYHDKNTDAGVKYDYTVRALSNGSISSYNKGLSTYFVATPSIKGVTQGTNGIKVNWSKVNKADSYSVYRKNEQNKWVKIHTTKNNSTLSFTDKNVVSGKSYTYTVVAWYKKSKSGYESNGVTASYFSTPKITSLRSYKCKNAVVIWNKIGGAKTYNVHRKEVGGKWNIIAVLNGNINSYTDNTVKVGKEYVYVISAVSNAGVKSGYSKEKNIRILNPKKPMVALTYDDGPSSDVTTRILDTLQKYDGRATFFVLGSRVNSYKSQIKRAYNMDCQIGNHTNSHSTLTRLSASGVKKEITETDRKIKDIIGEAPVVMRPPGGSYKNNTVKNNVGKPIIMWSVDTRDWESRNATKVVSNIKNNVKDGSIILMHDLYGSTASATEQIVPWLNKKGYQLVTVTELMDAKGITMQNGTAYSSAK